MKGTDIKNRGGAPVLSRFGGQKIQLEEIALGAAMVGVFENSRRVNWCAGLHFLRACLYLST